MTVIINNIVTILWSFSRWTYVRQFFSIFFFHLIPKRTFTMSGMGFLWTKCPSCYPNNISKHWRKCEALIPITIIDLCEDHVSKLSRLSLMLWLAVVPNNCTVFKYRLNDRGCVRLHLDWQLLTTLAKMTTTLLTAAVSLRQWTAEMLRTAV